MWRFSVQLAHQTGCPSHFASLEGVARDGSGSLAGLDHLAELSGADGPLREVARSHALDVEITAAVVHPIDSSPADFAEALLAVARAIRGGAPARWVRALSVTPVG